MLKNKKGILDGSDLSKIIRRKFNYGIFRTYEGSTLDEETQLAVFNTYINPVSIKSLGDQKFEVILEDEYKLDVELEEKFEKIDRIKVNKFDSFLELPAEEIALWEEYMGITDCLYSCPYEHRETYYRAARRMENDFLNKAKSEEEKEELIQVFEKEQEERERMVDLNDEERNSLYY